MKKTKDKMRGLREWHVAINKLNQGRSVVVHWMYEAKRLASESSRLAILFKKERDGGLPVVHQQCSLSQPEKVEDNHLACCLGKKCRDCEYLDAIESAKMTSDQKDQAKAWTCCAHILHECGKPGIIDTSEGYILTVDDRMFWDNVFQSLADGD